MGEKLGKKDTCIKEIGSFLCTLQKQGRIKWAMVFSNLYNLLYIIIIHNDYLLLSG
jgi:hypothetical protein